MDDPEVDNFDSWEEDEKPFFFCRALTQTAEERILTGASFCAVAMLFGLRKSRWDAHHF